MRLVVAFHKPTRYRLVGNQEVKAPVIIEPVANVTTVIVGFRNPEDIRDCLVALSGAAGCASDSGAQQSRWSDSKLIKMRMKSGYGLEPDTGGGWNAIERMTPPPLTN